MHKRLFLWIGLLLTILACNMGSSAPTPTSNLLATLAASTPLSGNPAATAGVVSTPMFNAATPVPTALFLSTVSVPTSSSTIQPRGKIVFTCQIFKVQASNQICIINADGTGFRRLTTDSNVQHYYPSLSPDGYSVVYAAFRESNVYEIYEMNIASGNVKQLTNKLGILNAPEISPDGKYIVFKHSTGASNKNAIWIMDRNGENAGNIPRAFGWDPTWSPDGKYILFASDMDGSIQLYTIRVNGKELKKISNLPAIRGRSDWSPDGQFIVTYSGEPWNREVYIMNFDGSGARILSPTGGNSQGPSISPDGQWVAFTAYFDHPGDDHGCEIYIMRVDGTDLRRLTSNDYCDYQPRWGQ
ncbi:MAG: PD40 domain-containing protein [Anaerolineales bacterium]|uniref:eIF2A-related protein n=1 Tax=Candidatus Villigracilis proximus TaxID=3140683 RepID=UPI003134C8F7|nr:PD40 domain-containing protein [Anaerolineales bacterium]